MEKVNITSEFCIFELVYVPNLTLRKQFIISGQNLPKKGFLLTTKKEDFTIKFC